ncbi:MAG: hypothetical protein LBR99_04330 [Treponema sp.]|jgi:hypothetical protein|nr:hypothetical protein [Treponema sp.]
MFALNYMVYINLFSIYKVIVWCAVIAYLGYDSNGFRREPEGSNNRAEIRGRKNLKEEIGYDKEQYKKGGLIERLNGKVKEDRRLAV